MIYFPSIFNINLHSQIQYPRCAPAGQTQLLTTFWGLSLSLSLSFYLSLSLSLSFSVYLSLPRSISLSLSQKYKLFYLVTPLPFSPLSVYLSIYHLHTLPIF